MIRPFTCVCMILAAGSGLYVYQTKHRGQMLDKEVARTLKATDAVRQRITVLRSEWAMLNEADHVMDLVRQHTAELSQQRVTLRTSATAQLVALNDLGARLPAPLPPGTNTLPTDEGEDAAPIQAAPAPAPPPVPVAARTSATRLAAAAPTRTPAHLPAAVAPPSPPVQVAALATPPAAKPSARPVPERVAERLPEPPAAEHAADRAIPAPRFAAVAAPNPAALPLPTPLPAPRPRILAPVVTVGAAPIAASAAAVSRPPVPVMRAAVPVAPTPDFGSALGGARPALPAPVPYASQAR